MQVVSQFCCAVTINAANVPRDVAQCNMCTPRQHINNMDSCTTSNLVYIITCRACTLSYIGETGRRLGDRFCEHLRSVKSRADLSVARHVSSPGHTTDDMHGVRGESRFKGVLLNYRIQTYFEGHYFVARKFCVLRRANMAIDISMNA